MKSVPVSDPDQTFAEMMIHHHQGVIDMSSLELLFGNESGAKMEAEKIMIRKRRIDLAKF